MIAQQGPGKHHVLGSHRLPVGEARFGIETKRNVASAVIGLDAPRQEAVERERLVIAPRHQAFDHETPDLLDGDAPHDQGVKAVERPQNALHEPPALGRIRIGIGHMGEIGRQGRGAVHGDGVTLRRQPLAGVQPEREAERQDTARKRPDGCAEINSRRGRLA